MAARPSRCAPEIGVIGHKTYQYDLCGDAVNTAARMCAGSEPGRVHVSQAAWDQLRGRFGATYRGTRVYKGKGEMHTYFLDNTPGPASTRSPSIVGGSRTSTPRRATGGSAHPPPPDLPAGTSSGDLGLSERPSCPSGSAYRTELGAVSRPRVVQLQPRLAPIADAPCSAAAASEEVAPLDVLRPQVLTDAAASQPPLVNEASERGQHRATLTQIPEQAQADDTHPS